MLHHSSDYNNVKDPLSYFCIVEAKPQHFSLHFHQAAWKAFGGEAAQSIFHKGLQPEILFIRCGISDSIREAKNDSTVQQRTLGSVQD